MSSGTFSAEISVDNLAALKAIENPPDKATRYARDTSPAGDLSREAGWYTFRFGDATAEDLPDIVAPTVGNGRWRSFVGGDVDGGGGGGGAVTVSFDSPPDRAPAFVGEEWYQLEAGTDDGTIIGMWKGVFTAGILGNSNALNVDGGAWIGIQFGL